MLTEVILSLRQWFGAHLDISHMCLKVISEAFDRGHRQRSRFRNYVQEEN